MEFWNKDKDFRKQYVEANKIITLKKFGTHDGRRLGPDEDPPVIPSRRPSNLSSSLTVSSPNVPTTTSAPVPVPVVVSVKEDSFPVLPSPDVSKRAKSKASDTPAQNEKIAVTVSERDIKEIEKEKARLMEEELERSKKAEELAQIEEKLRKERAADEKERLRMEQKAKAKEAEERKRRKAEKAQERAEFKARKEAEMKEKV
jgi:flagellar biosynthesis GTPase FlhF